MWNFPCFVYFSLFWCVNLIFLCAFFPLICKFDQIFLICYFPILLCYSHILMCISTWPYLILLISWSRNFPSRCYVIKWFHIAFNIHYWMKIRCIPRQINVIILLIECFQIFQRFENIQSFDDMGNRNSVYL
jgi:hypothetical protein